MEMILSLKAYFGRLALPLVVGLVVFAALFLGACATSQEEQSIGAPQAAATPAGASEINQPPQPPQGERVAPPSAGPELSPPSGSSGRVEAATTSRPPVQVVTSTNFVGDWAQGRGRRPGGGLRPVTCRRRPPQLRARRQ